MNLEYLADRILKENFLSKKELVKILEAQLNNSGIDAIIQRMDKIDRDKLVLMDQKLVKLSELADIETRINELKTLKHGGEEVSEKRYYSLKTAKKRMGFESQKINMELNRLNLMRKAGGVSLNERERQILSEFIKKEHGADFLIDLLNQ